MAVHDGGEIVLQSVEHEADNAVPVGHHVCAGEAGSEEQQPRPAAQPHASQTRSHPEFSSVC